MTVVFENPANGYRQKVDSVTAWLWTSIFGPFFFLFRGNTLHFFVWWIAALFGIGPFIYPFFAASILRRMYYERGYRAIEERPTDRKVVIALIAIPVVLTLIIILATVASDVGKVSDIASRSTAMAEHRERLAGRWRRDNGILITYLRDGTFSIDRPNGPPFVTGQWSVDGDKLTITTADASDKETIVSITDDVLTVNDDTGVRHTYAKIRSP